MPSIQFSGLASGLDTSSIIQALTDVERIPLQRLEAENRDLQSKISILDNLSSALSDLKNKANALGTTGDFLSYSGTISDEDVATVTASGDAIRGTYSLEVSQLAAAQRTYSDAIADKTAALSGVDETLSITIDGETTDINIAANSSLEDVVAAINTSGAKVSAGLMFDGANYRLQVVGNETGAANAITFAEGGLGLNLSAPANTVQAAVDAAFKLDGFDVTSATNTVTDALPGVSLELTETNVGNPATIEIAPDSEEVKGKIQEFVDAYNEVFKIINAQIGEGKGSETLNGDSSVRMVEQQLQGMISSVIPGLSGPNGDLALSQLGIKTTSTGELELDSGDLDEFLASDFRLAATFFAGDGTNDGVAGILDDMVEAFTSSSGLLTARKDGLNSQIDDNTDRIADQEAYLERFEESLRAQYTALEQTMSALQSQGQYLAQYVLG